MFCFVRAFRGFVKPYSDTFFYLFSEKGKGKSCDKSAMLRVRWYESVRQVLLAIQDECEIVKEVLLRGKDVASCFYPV